MKLRTFFSLFSVLDGPQARKERKQAEILFNSEKSWPHRAQESNSVFSRLSYGELPMFHELSQPLRVDFHPLASKRNEARFGFGQPRFLLVIP